MGLKPPSMSLEGWVPAMACQTHGKGMCTKAQGAPCVPHNVLKKPLNGQEFILRSEGVRHWSPLASEARDSSEVTKVVAPPGINSHFAPKHLAEDSD